MFLLKFLLILSIASLAICTDTQQCDDTNAVPQDCPRSCQPTCDQRDTSDLVCTDECLKSGCVCKDGYILNKDGGDCIPVDDCPNTKQCTDTNAVPQDCPRSCQPTCDQRDTSDLVCTGECLKSGCVCKDGYILNKDGGDCIPVDDCPNGNETRKCDDPNASPKDCPSTCQPTCDEPDTTGRICNKECLQSGCVCNSGYILDKNNGQCILKNKCHGNTSDDS